MNRIIINVDIPQKKFDIIYSDNKSKMTTKVFANTLQGFEYFLKRLKEEKCVVMEAIGRYEESLAYFLFAKGCHVSIINPSQIKHYSRSLLKRAKT